MAVDFSPTVQKFLQLRDALSPQLPEVTYKAPQVPAGASAVSSLSGNLTPDEAWIIQRESGGKTTARNPKPVIIKGKNYGHAFGLGQLVDTNRQYWARKLGISNPNTLDYNEQLRMFRAYVQSRYGTAAEARRHWERKGWY